MNAKLSILILFIFSVLLISCGKSGEEEVADKKETEQPEKNKPGDLESFVDNMKKMGETLKEGKNVETVDFRELKSMLPDEIGDMKRKEISGEKTSMFGMNVSHADATYRSEDGTKSIDFSITDMGSLKGLTGMAALAWAFAEIDRETENGYERTTSYEGYKAFEKYNNQTKHGEFSLLVSDRFTVQVDGYNVGMDEMKNAISVVGVDKLEALKVTKTAE